MDKRILIVEDNPRNMRLLEMTLRARGYRFLTTTDGEQAVGTAVRERSDLIVMDIQLPKIDGLEVTRQLRGIPAFSQTPIIAVTAYAMKGDKERAIDAGCDVYLTKPIDTRKLPQIIDHMLQQPGEEIKDNTDLG